MPDITTILRCALADLQGVLQAIEQNDLQAIDTDAIAQTIEELEEALGE